jgi:hypothetical protein
MPVNLNGQHILAKRRKEEVNFSKFPTCVAEN